MLGKTQHTGNKMHARPRNYFKNKRYGVNSEMAKENRPPQESSVISKAAPLASSRTILGESKSIANRLPAASKTTGSTHGGSDETPAAFLRKVFPQIRSIAELPRPSNPSGPSCGNDPDHTENDHKAVSTSPRQPRAR